MGHQPALYGQLSLAENLRFVARVTGRDEAAAERALAAVGLGAAAGRRAESCSQGMARRAELARVLLTEPTLLLLDEVHAGLDRDAVGLVDAARRVGRPPPGGPDVNVFGRRLPVVVGIAGAAGLITAMVTPPDAVQGELVRLMYVHLPAAWTAYLSYAVTFGASICWLWRRSRGRLVSWGTCGATQPPCGRR